MKKNEEVFFYRIKRFRKWERLIPLFFIVYLLLTLFWQYSNLTRLTEWVDRSDAILWDLKEADNQLLELHSSLRGFQLTESRFYLDRYYVEREELRKNFARLKKVSLRTELQQMVENTDPDLKQWDRFAGNIIRREIAGDSTGVITKSGQGMVILERIRNTITNIVEAELELRRSRKESLERETMSFYIFSAAGLIIISSFLILNWRRQRRLADILQDNQERYRNLAISARDGEERLRGLMESALDMIFIGDAQGKILFVNEQMCETLRYDRSELLSQDMDILIPERDLVFHYSERNTFFQELSSKYYDASYNINLKKKDGPEIPVEVSLSPFRLKGQLEFVAIIRDITSRKDFERRQGWMSEVSSLLSESLEPNNVLKTLGEFCLDKCADWSITASFVDPAQVMKLGPDGKVMKPDLFYHTPLGPLRDVFMHWLDKQGPMLNSDITPSDLSIFPIDERDLKRIFDFGLKSALIVPLRARNRYLGAIIYLKADRNYTLEEFNFAIELGERGALSFDNALLYEKAQQVSKAEEELIRIVSHDLKNPLNSLRLNLQMLARQMNKKELNDPRIRKRVDTMERILDRAIHLIKELLDTAKLETGGVELRRQPIEVSLLMKESEMLFESLATEKGITLEFSCELGHEEVLDVDHERILQVISNLIGNALKFTPKGGKITVSYTRTDDGTCFCVQDTGPGIPKEKMDHLFEKYWKDDKTGQQNLGLGLTIAKGIIDAHGGRIWANSSEGHGTTFYFLLPHQGEEFDKTYTDNKKNLFSLRPTLGDNLHEGG